MTATSPGVLADYPGQARGDEMVGPDGGVRELWSGLAALLHGAGPAGLARRRADTTRLLADDGVAYHPPGAETEQLWELDPLPLLLDGGEWAGLEAAVAQRAELADRLLRDLYGPRLTIRRGLLPVEVVDGHPGYLHGWRRPPGSYDGARREVFLSGTDLGRSPSGWVVLEDWVQAPSGAGYAMANRRVVARVLSALHRRSRIRRLGPFFEAVRAGLLAAAPPGTAGEPRVVLLNPGPSSETAYEQALLSALLGVPLVLGSELTVRGGRVWQQTVGELEPVDVVLRRLDAEWCDPLDLRPDSRLGVPGLLEASRLGTVSVLNGLGSGVLENPGLLPHLPRLCRELLGEPLVLPGIPTYWCGDAASRSHVLARLPELLISPIARGEGRRRIRGSELTAAQRERLAARIEAEPYAWAGQEEAVLSTTPSLDGRSGLDARPVSLRAFAVAAGPEAGGHWEVLDGGLAQVPAFATGRATLVGVPTMAKDVWVVGERPERPAVPIEELPVVVPTAAVATEVSPRAAEDLFWLGRYAERAEDTARLLRAVTDRWADFLNSPEPAGARALQALLVATTSVSGTGPGFTGGRSAEELHSLLCDKTRPGTLAYSVHRLTQAAMSVRELLSTDTWLVLARLDELLSAVERPADGEIDLHGAEVTQALNRVLEGLLALSGLEHESLVRDAVYHLLSAGRRIERAQHVVALLDATLPGEPPGAAGRLVTESVVIVAESIITYRRRHTGWSSLAPVLSLLLTDRDNPRAVAHQIDRLTADLAVLPGPAPEALGRVAGRLTGLDEQRILELASRGPDGTRSALHRLLGELGADLAALAGQIEAQHFARPTTPRPYDPLVAAP